MFFREKSMAREQVTSVAMRRAVWLTFNRYCRRNGLVGKEVLETLAIQFLSERGERIMDESELPPIVTPSRMMRV